LEVDDLKITHYLLAHPSKAPFFLGIGYTLGAWRVLREDLLQHPSMARFERFRPDTWGMKAIYRCLMPVAPNGRQYCVRTVWQQKPSGEWRFLSAYPQPAPASDDIPSRT
jgi:hypothetical protein